MLRLIAVELSLIVPDRAVPDLDSSIFSQPLQDWCLTRPLMYFGGRMWRIETFRICPTMLGVPARRPRRYTVVWNAAIINFSGSFQEFAELFIRETQLLGEIFFRAGPDVTVQASKTALQCHSMYTDAYKDNVLRTASACKFNICDLNQRPPYGRLDQWMPTLTTQHKPYNVTKKRLLTADESLEVQLLPHDHVARRRLREGSLSEAAARHLAGNTMSCACVGTMLLYVMASVRFVDEGSDQFLPQGHSRGFGDEV